MVSKYVYRIIIFLQIRNKRASTQAILFRLFFEKSFQPAPLTIEPILPRIRPNFKKVISTRQPPPHKVEPSRPV